MSPTDSKRYTTGTEPAVAASSDSSESRPAASGLPDEKELAERFRERLRVFATRRLGNAAAAEDVAQETLRRMVDALRAGRVDNPAAFPAFVFETARHVCQQHHRAAGREGRAFRRLHEDGEALHAVAPDPLSALVSDDRANRVREALRGLSDTDRELLRLLYHEELETNDASSRLGLSPSALRVRKHRALKRLAELLDEKDL